MLAAGRSGHGLSAALAAVLAMLLHMPSGIAHTSCPAPWGASGNATFYDAASGVNTCTLGNGNGMTAALSPADYGNSEHCGECLEVSGPLGTVVVKVTDKCPGCAPGNLDLSAPAFAAIADPADGVASIRWHRVACPVSSDVAFRFQGSNPYYIKLQVRDHRYGVQSMALQPASGSAYQTMNRSSDNFFVTSPATPVEGAFKVRLTSTSGEALEQTIGGIDNNHVITGTDQFRDCGLIFSKSLEGH